MGAGVFLDSGQRVYLVSPVQFELPTSTCHSMSVPTDSLAVLLMRVLITSDSQPGFLWASNNSTVLSNWTNTGNAQHGIVVITHHYWYTSTRLCNYKVFAFALTLESLTTGFSEIWTRRYYSQTINSLQTTQISRGLSFRHRILVSGMDPKRKDYRAEWLPSEVFTKEPIRKECDTVISIDGG